MTEATEVTVWPPYDKLDAHTVPKWLAQSAAEMGKAFPDALRGIYFDLWGRNYYDDNNNFDLKASLTVSWLEGKSRPSEDDLDHIPAMRRMERLAEDLWEHVPLDLDDEANIPGEMSYNLDRDGFTYSFMTGDWGGECDYEAEARYGPEGWTYEERIYLHEFEVSETALAIKDVKGIISQINASTYGFSEWPEDLDYEMEVDEDGVIVIKVKGGGLFKLYERSVA